MLPLELSLLSPESILKAGIPGSASPGNLLEIRNSEGEAQKRILKSSPSGSDACYHLRTSALRPLTLTNIYFLSQSSVLDDMKGRGKTQRNWECIAITLFPPLSSVLVPATLLTQIWAPILHHSAERRFSDLDGSQYGGSYVIFHPCCLPHRITQKLYLARIHPPRNRT